MYKDISKIKNIANYLLKHIEKACIGVKNYIKVMLIFILIIFSLSFTYVLSNLDKQKQLEIVFLDIGQGDSALIKLPSGQKGLIDTGANYISSQKVENNLPYFSQDLDFILLTHPDLDHVGGTQDILDNFRTKKLIISTENTYEAYDNINKVGKNKNVTQVYKINNLNKILLSKGLSLEILGPYKHETGSDNHKSIINSLKYGNFEFIFTGDADQEAERNIVSQGYFDENKEKDLKINKTIKILKVGHHGSDTSSSEIFLRKLKPEYCIISVGKDNKYKHPAAEVMGRLEKYCKNIYRTDQDGSVSLKTDGKNISIDNDK